MIRVDKGTVEVKGSKFIMAAELSVLINTLYKEDILKKDEITRAVDNGFMSDNELAEGVKQKMDELINLLKEL